MSCHLCPTFILSVSMAVLAMRIRAFSSLLGWFTPTFFSRRKPEWKTEVEGGGGRRGGGRRGGGRGREERGREKWDDIHSTTSTMHHSTEVLRG